ncbi:MAG TPA: hypothetical protein VKR55_26220 [Bradyrhizobium sp.]|uniref:hypothetical protein n=1 Tax=Bradyrhizobium sp. TaxID=376 RepID=UPI002CB896BA|nr:hypothetical protein [Bradyrhizobium sp.]HLZ05633.1 hypothetical protein [Bradyrhizobium sp.]
MYGSAPLTLGFAFVALLLVLGLAGWTRPKARAWKFVDIGYYLLGGAGVILLAASTQRDALLASINSEVSEAQAAFEQAQGERSLSAAEVVDLDKQTSEVLSGVIRMIPKSACDDHMSFEAFPSPFRNRPTACALRDGLQYSLDRILGIKTSGDQPSPAIVDNGQKRCGEIIEIKKEIEGTKRIAAIDQINGLFLSYPPQLYQVADSCERYPAVVKADREIARERLKKLREELRADSQLADDPFWASIRYSLWPYLLLIGLSLKFGKAVTVFR